MSFDPLSFVQGMSPELATMLLGALPMTEMRASIPVAITVFHLSAIRAAMFSAIGNLLPIPFVFWALPAIVLFLERRLPSLHALVQRYFAFVRRKHDRAQAVGGFALVLIALLPLPGAGIWTGCVVAVLFGLPIRSSIAALVFGVVVEAVVLTLVTTGTLGALSWIL